MNNFFRSTITAVSALILATGLATQSLAQSDTNGKLPLPIDDVRLFTEALDAIRTAYVDEIDDRTLLEYAIRGMLSGLDPHSAYLSAKDYDDLQESTQGEFGGLGIEIGEEDGYIKIISPIDDSPADRAGIMAGDLIVEIDGRPVRDMTVSDAVELLRGEIGSSVSLTLRRANEPELIDVTLERASITATSVRGFTMEPGYAYLRISQFRTNTGREVVNTLRELQTENDDQLHGLVLDLRNNPGGVLGASVDVADAFLSGGRVVYTDGRLRETANDFYAGDDDPSQGVPMVVLINAGSASAAEIVAGALQDHRRAVIMGTQSFGKGSVQTLLPLSNERAIKLTTSLYYTPEGRSIQAQGITPDIVVDQGLVTRQTPRRGVYTEADLEGHLRGSGESSERRPVISSEQVVVSDYQLNEALTLLKGWHIMESGRAQRARNGSEVIE